MSECFWVPPLGSFLTVFLSEIMMRLFMLCNKPLLYLRTLKSATMIKCISLIMLFPLVTTGSPRDGIGPEAGRLGLSHWAGPSVTGSAKVSQSFYGGIIIVILTKGNPVPLVWEFIYKLGEVTRVTSTILPDMGRKCVTEA